MNNYQNKETKAAFKQTNNTVKHLMQVYLYWFSML